MVYVLIMYCSWEMTKYRISICLFTNVGNERKHTWTNWKIVSGVAERLYFVIILYYYYYYYYFIAYWCSNIHIESYCRKLIIFFWGKITFIPTEAYKLQVFNLFYSYPCIASILIWYKFLYINSSFRPWYKKIISWRKNRNFEKKINLGWTKEENKYNDS